MTEIVERLRREQSSPIPTGLALEAADEIERLRSNQERMWCKACGTVTRDDSCDCTAEGKAPQFVNYADDTNEQAHEFMAEIERLRAENARLQGHNERLQADIAAIKRYG